MGELGTTMHSAAGYGKERGLAPLAPLHGGSSSGGSLGGPRTSCDLAALPALDDRRSALPRLPSLGSSSILNAEQTEQAKNVFKSFDTNGNGTIEKQEMVSAMSKLVTTLQGDLLEKKVTSLFQSADRDLSGGLTFEEFLGVYNEISIHITDFEGHL